MNHSKHQHSEFAFHPTKLQNEITKLENNISGKTIEIWKKIKQVDPKSLLMMSTDLEKMSSIEEIGDILLHMPGMFPARPTEYIQSVIASSKECAQASARDENTESICMEIMADIEKLYELAQTYTIYWGVMLSKSIENTDLCGLIVEAQAMYLVRGNRYQLFQENYFTPLLLPHDDEFQELFEISAAKVISGLMSLEYALSQGRIEGLNVIGEIFDRYADSKLPEPEEMPQNEINTLQEAFFETFSAEHYDVAKITGWPESFIGELAYSPGEATWYETGKYENWPIVALPIQTKPFIKLEGNTYCFDYYSLMDNFYRVIQKVIIGRDPSYRQIWQIKQKESSESTVAELLTDLLPGCICHSSNYYSLKEKKGHLNENDLIIHFRDVLIIIEVKAGSFTYAPPITDWEKHVRDYKSLIEEADHQCAKAREYFSKFEKDAPLLDSQGHEKARIDMSEITDIFELSITIDDINTFASKAERLSFLNLDSGAISISINDLMVYHDYFENPFRFLHFLRQRRSASRNQELVFNDELDHLGMYIENNFYAAKTKDNHQYDSVFVIDLRDDLDKYYSQSRQHNLDVEKPHQKVMPEFFSNVLDSPGVATMINPVQFTSFLLDFSSETKISFSEQIGSLLKLARKRGRAQILNFGGKSEDEMSLRMSCFVESVLDHSNYGIKDYRDYALSMMLTNCERDRNMVILSFDSQGILNKVVSESMSPDFVKPEDSQHLLDLGTSRANDFVEKHRKEHGKIGRNELCPCGSGLKYKKCHGR